LCVGGSGDGGLDKKKEKRIKNYRKNLDNIAAVVLKAASILISDYRQQKQQRRQGYRRCCFNML
jgi:hypothetical protein